MFSLTTLPVHCCSTIYRRDVTDLISYPRTIAIIADIYLGILLLVRKPATLRDRDVVKSSTYRNATTKCSIDKVIRQTNNLTLPMKLNLYRAVNTLRLCYKKTNQLMLYRGIIAVFFSRAIQNT